MNLKGFFGTISRSWLAAIAIAFGFLTLLGVFFTSSAFLVGLRFLFLDLAVILAGFAIFVGVANLINVHSKKIRRHEKGANYSIWLITFLVITFVLGLIARFVPIANSLFSGAFNYIQLPVEATLMGILAVTLVLAAVRLLRRRFAWTSVIFLATALFIIFVTISFPFLGEIPKVGDYVRLIFTPVFAGSGARGILLGVGLGTLAMGLRVLLGADRPYGGK